MRGQVLTGAKGEALKRISRSTIPLDLFTSESSWRTLNPCRRRAKRGSYNWLSFTNPSWNNISKPGKSSYFETVYRFISQNGFCVPLCREPIFNIHSSCQLMNNSRSYASSLWKGANMFWCSSPNYRLSDSYTVAGFSLPCLHNLLFQQTPLRAFAQSKQASSIFEAPKPRSNWCNKSARLLSRNLLFFLFSWLSFHSAHFSLSLLLSLSPHLPSFFFLPLACCRGN